MAAISKDAHSSQEHKIEATEIATPIEADFLSKFKENQVHLDWLQKVRTKYGDDKLSAVNDHYPFVIERIIYALAARERSNETMTMIELYMKYYDDYDLGNILSIKLKKESLLCESWPVYIFGEDRSGHPVFYDEVACADASKIYEVFQSAVGGECLSEDILNLCRMFRFKFYAKVTRQKQLQSQKYGTTILKHVLVHDLRDFSFLSIAMNFNFYANIAKTVITDEQLLYPETLHKMLLINCPQSFLICWKVISSVIDPGVLDKIKLLGTDYQEEMLKYIDIEQIPPRYGGKAKWKVQLGDVPDMNVDE